MDVLHVCWGVCFRGPFVSGICLWVQNTTVSALSQVVYSSHGKLLRVSCEGQKSLLSAAVEVAGVNSSCGGGWCELQLLASGVNSSCWLLV